MHLKLKALYFVQNILRPKPLLELCIKGVTIEQAKLLLADQLSRPCQIDKVVVKMGRGMSVIERCSAFSHNNCQDPVTNPGLRSEKQSLNQLSHE
jgi:hypothetical protein